MNEDEKIELNGISVNNDAKYKMCSRFSFSSSEFDEIRKGYARRSNMDYRWYLECIDDTVYLLRSWNPTIIFKIPFERVGDKYISDYSESAFDPEKEKLEGTIKAQNYWNFWIYSLITQLIFNEPPIMTFDYIITKVKIDLNGVHGFDHWRSIYRIGNELYPDADKKVLFYFSVFHDLFRENDYHDPEHGERAADFVESIYLHEKVISKKGTKLAKQMLLLQFAIKNHDLNPKQYSKIKNPIKTDKTVRVCIDADRLDLGRVGVQPDEQYLLTEEAKHYLKEL